MLKATIFGAILLSLLSPIPQAGASAEDTTLTSYHDAALGLTYQYPASFVPHPELGSALSKGIADAASQNGEQDAQQEAKCFTLPVSAARQTQALDNGVELGIVIMLRVDHTCLGEPGSADKLGQAAQMMMKVLSRFGHPVTEDALHYQLGGHEAYFVQGSAPAKMLGDGKMLHAASVCALVATHTVCWLLVDSDYKAMPTLVATPVTFDGHTPIPLVPKDMVPKW